MGGCKISPVGLGMSLGVLWGVSLLGMGLMTYFYAYGKPFVDAMAMVYFGYEPSIQGSIIGGIMGLINGFITGFLIAWLYNRFSCGSCCCTTTEHCAPVVTTTPVAPAAPAAPKTPRAPRKPKE